MYGALDAREQKEGARAVDEPQKFSLCISGRTLIVRRSKPSASVKEEC